MTKAVSNRKICFNKAVLLFCEHGHMGVFYHPPILLGLIAFVLHLVKSEKLSGAKIWVINRRHEYEET